MTKSILLISYFAPCRDHAGGLRLLDLYTKIRQLRPDLHIALLSFEQPDQEWNELDLKEIFDEVHCIPLADLKKNCVQNAVFQIENFDFVDLQYHQSGALISDCRARFPKALIVFSPMESMLRAFRLPSSCKFTTKIARNFLIRIFLALQEIRYARLSDRIITVSKPDQTALAKIKSRAQVFCVPTGTSLIEPRISSAEISQATKPIVVFFAFFGSVTNCEALLWFCREVHPRLKQLVPGYCLHVVGRGITRDLIDQCGSAGIEFIGQVDTIYDGLRNAAAGIAPALNGAGVRGKIHQYAAMGIPCVASPLACEGLDYRDRESILIAKDSAAFAAACAMLLRNTVFRQQIGNCARQLCFEHYSWNAIEEHIIAAYEI